MSTDISRKYMQVKRLRVFTAIVLYLAVIGSLYLGVRTIALKMQIVPAMLTGAVIWLVIWVLLTLLFGRVYCSTVCPMGTSLDILSRCSAVARGKKRPEFRYRRGLDPMRYVMLFAAVASFVAGVGAIIIWLDPAECFEKCFGTVIHIKEADLSAIIVTAVTVILLTATAWKHGRLWCNSVCPVGALLSLLAKYSLYHPDINPDICVGCGTCELRCKAECINHIEHTIDSSRCVGCFNCVAGCPTGAIDYRRGRHRLTTGMLQKIDACTAGQSSSKQITSKTTKQ